MNGRERKKKGNQGGLGFHLPYRRYNRSAPHPMDIYVFEMWRTRSLAGGRVHVFVLDFHVFFRIVRWQRHAELVRIRSSPPSLLHLWA
jgi:hypothetical protein